jgi:hypothetical protein
VKKLLLAATVLSALLPSAADAKKKKPAPPPPPVVVRVAPTDPVEAYYFHHGEAPIWFRDAASRAAAAKLSGLLRRATIDGFVYGPQLASQVDAAIAQAASPDPSMVKAAEVIVSKAWVAYVQHLRTPPKGQIFGYAMLQPHSRPDQILLTAAASGPLLSQHLDRTTDVNPFYRQIRDAALAQGLTVPDVRLLANLERARVLPSTGRFIVVDAATARLTMYESGQPVDSMKVVVGTPETPTPMIASVIHYLTLNPYWNVPPNLIVKTVAPAAVKQGASYLKPRGYQVVADWTADAPVVPPEEVNWKAVAAGQKQVRVRQLPGPGNSMGKMKVPFPSGVDIYLHDTPSRDKFNAAARQLSNGCIRLEDAQRLGRWLMRSDPASRGTDPEQFVQLPQGVPVYLTYLTAQVSDGKLSYLNDVYGWDGQPDRQAAAAQYTPPAGALR